MNPPETSTTSVVFGLLDFDDNDDNDDNDDDDDDDNVDDNVDDNYVIEQTRELI